jgi:putative membrane protein
MHEQHKIVFQYHGGGRPQHPLLAFLSLWGVNTLSLWAASTLFPASIGFQDAPTLLISGLVLGLVNIFIKPLMLLLTLPISVFTLGFFILVVNALMLLLVSWMVPGFTIGGFWAGFWIALFVSVFSFIINRLLGR